MEWTRVAWMLVGVIGMLGVGMSMVRAGFASKYEEPTYTVVRRTADFEVRDYGSRLLAEVTLSGERQAGASSGFRILASYIFSEDTPEGTPIGMTVPVGQYEDDGAWHMWFAMPARYTIEDLPPPNDPRIRIVERAAERLVVRALPGRLDTADFSKAAAQLESDAREAGLQPIGPATLAVYNGPMTPGPLRRNEVLIPVATSVNP